MKLLDYQIDDVRRAVREYVTDHSLVNDVDVVLEWVEGCVERQALQDLAGKIDEIIHPNQWRQ